MAYCSLAELQAYLPMVTISATGTTPTEAQATAYIGHVSAEIDAILRGRGYSLPVSDADALAYLKGVALNGAASMTLRAKHPTQPDIDAAYREAYREALADIRNGVVLVPDAELDTDTIGEGFTLTSAGETYAPSVTLETEF